MSILDDLKIMADVFDDEGDREMHALFIRCITEIRKLRLALEPLAGIDLCGGAVPDDFALLVLRARDALKTPNAELRGAEPIGAASLSNDVLGTGGRDDTGN